MREFLKEMFASHSGVSSKRVCGVGCIAFAMVGWCGSMIAFECMNINISTLKELINYAQEGIKAFLFVGMVLLGVTLLETQHQTKGAKIDPKDFPSPPPMKQTVPPNEAD